jgi:hypothetical protein
MGAWSIEVYRKRSLGEFKLGAKMVLIYFHDESIAAVSCRLKIIDLGVKFLPELEFQIVNCRGPRLQSISNVFVLAPTLGS